jgi:hypothetical protein
MPMDLSLVHARPTTIFLATAGFSLLVAGVDFVTRRAGFRGPAKVKDSLGPIPAQPPALRVEEDTIKPATESPALAPLEGIAWFPHTDRTAPSLPFGDFMALPKPAPSVPPISERLDASVSWWQEV